MGIPTPSRSRLDRAAGGWILLTAAITTVGMVGGYRLGRGVASSKEGETGAALNLPGESLLARTPPADEAQIGFEPADIDLGARPWSSSVDFESSFVNDSGAPVTIAALRTSCGCTTLPGSVNGSAIEAGGRLAISGVVKTDLHTGRRSEDVSILLDTGAVYVLPLHFEVLATYAVHPEDLDFGDIDLGEQPEAVASAMFTSETAHVLGQPQTNVPWLEAFAVPREQGGTSLVVRVLADQMAYGRNWGHIVVNTDDSYRPTCTINVRAAGIAGLRPVPSHIVLRAGEGCAARFFMPTGVAAQLVRAEASAGDVSVRVPEDDQAIALIGAEEGAVVATYRVNVVAKEGQRGHVLVTVAP
jgi:hypothetical protein